MKTKTFILSMLLLLMAGLTFQSCNKAPEPDDNSPLDNLNIPDGFTFESTRVENVTIKMPSTVSFETDKSRFNIYTADPADGGQLITAGSFDENGEWTGEIRVPTALDSVYVQSVAGGVYAQLPEQNTKEGGVTVDFGEDYETNIPPDTIPPESTTTKSASYTVSSAHYSGAGIQISNNLIQNGDFETDNFGSIYGWSSDHPIDGKWYFTSYRNQRMEWYNDGGNHVVRTPVNHLYSYYGGVTQMIAASAGDLITFSADIKSVGNPAYQTSWLYIIPMDSQNRALAYICKYYPHPANHWVKKTICATMPSGTAKVNILLWNWDLDRNGSIYCDNVEVTKPSNDSDGDGVPDDQDDYPNDPARAFNVYYPNQTDWGTLAFEDLWPGKGDYDFNDLVVDYHFKSVLNASNQLVEFFTDYSVRAVGASLKNGFGFMLGGNPSNVASVTGTHLTENYIHNNPNGTEQGQTNTVVILFDNAFRMIGSSGSAFINTKEDVPYVEPDTNELHVLYANPVSVSTTGTAPYNPFIIINGERGKEVHLAGQKPTDLVNTSYFGTYADATDPATGKYYQTENNLPWGLDLPVSFAYPKEQVDILSAYNYFGQWAESGGNDYPDWYMDKPGYRVSSNIYTPPAGK
ncbi:LruC domain-containing protein [Candidatus Sulfidibacterium hydrothermale]|uniref:LruC domain-containing protein n=1 Tax=Candidatus Sulfidibacterium hydrothermale TaxID=2875962 RepID=UPI001F0B18CC|nr:LruC domain-containing protein [Candidatus Sulfidibacterium hydrothermale]UBM62040.1 LruC domain-containing protein [Candidatus Sulfidibacterium hydrothermale]